MIQVKDHKVLGGMLSHWFDDKLVELCQWCSIRYSNFVVTESWRKKKHPSDLHGETPVRAIDIRSWVFDKPKEVERDINNNWSYDSHRSWMRCAVYHNSGSGAHIHLQVHPNTRRRKEVKE